MYYVIRVSNYKDYKDVIYRVVDTLANIHEAWIRAFKLR